MKLRYVYNQQHFFFSLKANRKARPSGKNVLQTCCCYFEVDPVSMSLGPSTARRVLEGPGSTS